VLLTGLDIDPRWSGYGESSETPPGPAPRHRPLLAGDQLLAPVVDGDRRLPLRLLVVVAQEGGDRRRSDSARAA